MQLLQSSASGPDPCTACSCCLHHCTSCWPQTTEGQPPDIWCRLPYEALEAAIQNYKDAAAYSWDVPGAFQSMARAAAEHSHVLEQETKELRKEVVELRATVASLEIRQQQRDQQQQQRDKEQQQRDKQQREEVAALQGTVAALAVQVRAFLQQNGMQQG